jgi:tellurite resistance protein TerA
MLDLVKHPKITNLNLSKKASISLRKVKNLGEIIVNLNWNQNGRTRRNVDIDIGCFVETDSSRNAEWVVDGLNPDGSMHNYPYVDIDQDDRTGNSATGETLRVNSKELKHIKRILLYTYIYEGADDWNDLDAVVTIKFPNKADMIIKMNEFNRRASFCVLAEIINDGQTLEIRKILDFLRGKWREATDKYGWHFRWKSGSKD